MEKSAKYLILTMMLSMLIFLNNNVLQAQSDSFFSDDRESRKSGDIGYELSEDDYVFSYKLFEENGFTFNGFENGNPDDGFTFGNFDFSPDNAPIGNGLLLLSCAGVFYVGTRRNKKENNK